MKVSYSLQMKPKQQLAMTMKMQQALAILQMPLLELSNYLQTEIEKNPMLELIAPPSPVALQLSDSPAKLSLTDSLLSQAREVIKEEADLQAIKALITNLDTKGWVRLPLPLIAKEYSIDEQLLEKALVILQSFEPAGIGARNGQDCLLIQLRKQQRENSLIFHLIRDHYDDFIKGRCKQLTKKELKKELASLYLYPIEPDDLTAGIPAQADIFFKKKGQNWIVTINEYSLPSFRLNKEYTQLLKNDLPKDEKETLQKFTKQGKWLMCAINKRRELLLKIGLYIVKKQQKYLSGNEAIAPLTKKEIASTLQVAPSTIARAFQQKYINTPYGIKPLYFFLSAPINNGGRSVKAATQALKNLLENEDPLHPYSDRQLSEKLKQEGYFFARRTVAKYRTKLQLHSSFQRKEL